MSDILNGVRPVLPQSFVPSVRAFVALGDGTPTQPALGSATISATWSRDALGLVRYSGIITFASDTTFGSGDRLWGVRLPWPANRSTNGADLPIGTAYVAEGASDSPRWTQLLVPTLLDPVNSDLTTLTTGAYVNDEQDRWMQFFTAKGGVASGTATIAQGTSSITVNHGLPFAPQAYDIQIMPTGSPTTAPRIFYVNGITSTQFVVNTGVSLTTGTLPFSWKAVVEPDSGTTYSLLFGSKKPWTLASGHSLAWSVVYEGRR